MWTEKPCNSTLPTHNTEPVNRKIERRGWWGGGECSERLTERVLSITLTENNPASQPPGPFSIHPHPPISSSSSTSSLAFQKPLEIFSKALRLFPSVRDSANNVTAKLLRYITVDITEQLLLKLEPGVSPGTQHRIFFKGRHKLSSDHKITVGHDESQSGSVHRGRGMMMKSRNRVVVQENTGGKTKK